MPSMRMVFAAPALCLVATAVLSLVATTALSLVATTAMAQSRFTAEQAAVLQEGLTTTADAVIRPNYDAFAAATATLAANLDAHCAAKASAPGVEAVRAAFAASFLAWQRASIVQVGPIMEAEGPLRFQLWPDPKGFSRRAVRQALAAEDPALLADNGLAGRSIALINLTALEDLVHGDALAANTYGCDLAAAIARHHATLARHIAGAWAPGAAFRSDYDTAREGNARFATVDDVLRDVLSGLVVAADRTRKFKIERGLGAAPGDARPERTEAVASGLGRDSLAASFQALADLLDTPFGVFDAAADVGGAMDYLTLASTAGSVAGAIAGMDGSLAAIAAADGAAAQALRREARLLLAVERYFKLDFPASINLTSGFTSADGD